MRTHIRKDGHSRKGINVKNTQRQKNINGKQRITNVLVEVKYLTWAFTGGEGTQKEPNLAKKIMTLEFM